MRAAFAFVFLLLAPITATAGWLSDAVHGKAPPLRVVAPCIVSPAACAVIEAKKDDDKKRAIEEQNRVLTEELSKRQTAVSDYVNKLNIKSDKEREEVRGALSDAEVCIANAKIITDTDKCILKMQSVVAEIQRKYAS